MLIAPSFSKCFVKIQLKFPYGFYQVLKKNYRANNKEKVPIKKEAPFFRKSTSFFELNAYANIFVML
jgi:hypothetical protein